MVLADTEVVDPHLIGQDAFVDDVANRLGVRQRPTIVALGDVAERIQTERDTLRRRRGFVMSFLAGCHADLRGSRVVVMGVPTRMARVMGVRSARSAKRLRWSGGRSTGTVMVRLIAPRPSSAMS